jgi:hypothetical protein
MTPDQRVALSACRHAIVALCAELEKARGMLGGDMTGRLVASALGIMVDHVIHGAPNCVTMPFVTEDGELVMTLCAAKAGREPFPSGPEYGDVRDLAKVLLAIDDHDHAELAFAVERVEPWLRRLDRLVGAHDEEVAP